MSIFTFVIYDHPKDFPDYYVARGWLDEIPTNMVFIAKTLDEIRATIPLDMICIQRMEDDDPCIVEVWI